MIKMETNNKDLLKKIKKVSFVDIYNKRIYYYEIIHPTIFKELYSMEKPTAKFLSKVTVNTNRPFTTFLAKDRKLLCFKENDILLIRIIKNNQEFQIATKIYKWGKFHLPKDVIKILDIKNHEIINFEILAKNQDLDIIETNMSIDLAAISDPKINVLPRARNFITLYSKHKIPITLPRLIEITPKLLELFYLIHGDGHYQNKLYFVNKTPELHEFVLEQFKNIFCIPRKLWRTRILISDLNFGNYAKDYWQNKLNLDEKQFYNISKSKLNTNEKGNLRIIIDKTIVSSVFRFIFNHLKIYQKNSLHALNGLLCAEGGAQIDKIGLHKVTLSFNRKEKDMFKCILDNLNLKYNIEQNRNFVIQGWNNLYLFFKIFFSKNIVPFNIHNQRRNNAINGFLNHSFTKTMIKYLSVLEQKNNITLKEFSKDLKIRKDSILDTIRKKQYNKFINIDGKGIRGNPFIISITDEGDNLLNIINKMEVKQCEITV
jgi:DNA-binding MarR family transcriptional regulator